MKIDENKSEHHRRENECAPNLVREHVVECGRVNEIGRSAGRFDHAFQHLATHS